MQELNPKQILETIEKLEELAKRLDASLPEEVIIDAEPPGIDSLLRIRGIAIDVGLALKLASGAILHLQGVVDEQEAET